MRKQISAFEERIMILLGGAALLGFGIRKRLPPWTGVMLLGVGGAAVVAGPGLLHSKASPLDRVTEASEESFPASDAPAY
jgi:hypothetical protein